MTEPTTPSAKPGPASGPWNWHPPLPLEMPPVFAWPPRPLAALKFLLGRGFLLSQAGVYIALAVLTWHLLPDMAHWREFRPGWIAQVYGLNMALSLLFAGGLHLYFHTWKKQGKVHRYERRELARDNRAFLFRNQVWDNMFWTLVSGVTFWTAWQVLLMWAFANGYTPWSDFAGNPLWFIALFFILTCWESAHFYCVHRLLHWPPLYKIAHALHHRNVVVGPWSGLAMHPVEHFLYFSTAIVHLIVASHPIHLFYNMYVTALSAYTGHVGYEDVVIKGRPAIPVANLFHTLHHRYFECNYGTPNMPLDKWLDTMHDGTEAATARINQRRARMQQT